MHYRNVRSPKECYYGYYPKNPSKPVAPPCPCRYLALSTAHIDHNKLLFSASIFCSFLVLCAKPKRSNKGWCCSWKKMGSAGVSGQFPFMHTQARVLYSEATYANTFLVRWLFNGKHPTECVWVLHVGHEPEKGFRRILCDGSLLCGCRARQAEVC